MGFSWSWAIQVALIGFAGVFVILLILLIGLIISSKLLQRFGSKSVHQPKKEG